MNTSNYYVRQDKQLSKEKIRVILKIILETVFNYFFQAIPILILAVIKFSLQFDFDKFDFIGNVYLVEIVTAASSLYGVIVKRYNNQEYFRFRIVNFLTIMSLVFSTVLYCAQLIAVYDKVEKYILINDDLFIAGAAVIAILEFLILFVDNYRNELR